MRVLIIEDNPDIAANLGDYLEDHGHTVDFAGDGVTGLHLAVVNDFDSIVLDLALPGKSGLELLEILGKRQHHMPIFVITGNADLRVRAKALDLGADAVFMKPSDPRLLLETIHEAIC